MEPKRKATRPNPEALAALVARMTWFFAKREVEREMEQRAAQASPIAGEQTVPAANPQS